MITPSIIWNPPYTPLSAFDSALKDAGVFNYNLIRLSSVIPKGAVLKRQKYETDNSEHGYKLYIVKAEMRSREPGKYIGAGIGWHQLPDGRGVFVEHETIDQTEEIVESTLKKDINDSLTDLCISRKYMIPKRGFEMEINVMRVENSPSSILVLAVYQSQNWS